MGVLISATLLYSIEQLVILELAQHCYPSNENAIDSPGTCDYARIGEYPLASMRDQQWTRGQAMYSSSLIIEEHFLRIFRVQLEDKLFFACTSTVH